MVQFEFATSGCKKIAACLRYGPAGNCAVGIRLKCLLTVLLPSANEVCGKVMFFTPVCDSVHRGSCKPHPSPPGQTPHFPLGRHPTPWVDTPPPPDGHCSRRYASYWNASLSKERVVSRERFYCDEQSDRTYQNVPCLGKRRVLQPIL